MEVARVDIARYTGQVALDENALNLLVGTPVAADLLPKEQRQIRSAGPRRADGQEHGPRRFTYDSGLHANRTLR